MRMRQFLAVFGFLAIAGLVAGAAPAGGLTVDWSNNTSDSPTATTNGRWWINTGSGATLLQFDVNAQVLGGTTSSNLAVLTCGDLTSTFLLSDGTATNDIAGAGDGWFIDFSGNWYQVQGTDKWTGEAADWFQVTAWTGNYNTYAAAYQASASGQPVYVANVTFQNPTAGALGMPLGDMSNSPAIVLRRGLSGDANMDGKVDINDLTRVLTNYNQSTGMSWNTGDFNGDGKVDINDLTIVLSNYNRSFGSSAGAGMTAVPEPSALLLLLVGAGWFGLLALACRKRT